MIHDIIYQSMDQPKILMSPGMEEAMQGLRSWLFQHVYKNEVPQSGGGTGTAADSISLPILYGACYRTAGGVSADDGAAKRIKGTSGLRLYCGYERQLCHSTGLAAVCAKGVEGVLGKRRKQDVLSGRNCGRGAFQK